MEINGESNPHTLPADTLSDTHLLSASKKDRTDVKKNIQIIKTKKCPPQPTNMLKCENIFFFWVVLNKVSNKIYYRLDKIYSPKGYFVLG